MRDSGCAILLVSVELEEILSLSDRILVMNSGEIMGIVSKANTTKAMLGKMMAGIPLEKAIEEKINASVKIAKICGYMCHTNFESFNSVICRRNYHSNNW